MSITTPLAGLNTPIASLNRSMYSMAQHRNELDRAFLAAPEGPLEDAAYAAFDATLGPILGLYDPIRDLPAQTVEDAAVQATIAFYYADKIDGCTFDEDDVAKIASDLLTLLSSVVLALVKVGDLDIDRLGWGDMRRLCALRSPNGEVRA